MRVVADEQLDDRVDEVTGAAGAGVEPKRSSTVTSALSPATTSVCGNVARPSPSAPVQHHDRLLDDDTRRHLDERAAGEERVVQHA